MDLILTGGVKNNYIQQTSFVTCLQRGRKGAGVAAAEWERADWRLASFSPPSSSITFTFSKGVNSCGKGGYLKDVCIG